MFNISKTTYQQIQSGAIRPDQLTLQESTTQRGRVWEIKSADEMRYQGVTGVACRVLAQGPQVAEILRAVANGEPLPEAFKELRSIQKFRVFALKVPGMETAEHRQGVQMRVAAKASRVREVLGALGKGISELTPQPWRLVGSDYVLPELILRHQFLPVEGAHALARCWKESDSKLSFSSWLRTVKREWKAAITTQEFLPWLTAREWDKRERKAWERSHPGETFSEIAFAEWKRAQYPPGTLLSEPEWLARESWDKDNEEHRSKGETEVPYDQWTNNTIEGRKKFWEGVPKRSEGAILFDQLDDATYKRLDDKMFAYDQSGSVLDPFVWIARELWKETGPADTSDQLFFQHLDNQQFIYAKRTDFESQINDLRKQRDAYKRGEGGRAQRQRKLNDQIKALEAQLVALKKTPSQAEVDNWKREKHQKLETRWKASRTPLTFDQWKSQQVLDPLHPVPFVTLDRQMRKAYQTDCVNGCLTRAQGPFATTLERTAHSGEGWVIFVIGSKQELYCASHLPGVFHHSSFLGDAAVMAGGEIKTAADGTITHLSSKSGHYRPTDTENRAMLRWFQSHGADLSKISFTCFLPGGKESQPINALAYLNGAVPLPKPD